MRVFGFDVSVKKAGSPVDNRGGWWPWVREPYAGAWQRNEEWTAESVLSYHAVYACITLISSDIGKLRTKLVQQGANGIWSEISSPAFSPVLRKPNRYQNYIQFKEWWTTSKLTSGNAYALKERDNRGVVTALYLLDPSRVTVLVAPDGSVFYRLAVDNLSGVRQQVEVPASEIIHDRMNCLFHPLVGISPIFAAGMAANVGIQAQKNASSFFANDNTPSGILTAPGMITQAQADEMSARWKARPKASVAVLGNGLTFNQLRMTSEDAQMIEHLKWSAETVCSTFHVPAFKVGVGQMPTYQNAEILNQIYYSDCLQSLIEQFELAMDEGLGIGVADPKDGKTLGVELDLDALLRMDTATQIKTLTDGIKGSLYTPDEARAKIDLQPLPGGNTVYMQQQNFSLAALAERDKDKPFAKPEPAAPAPEAAPAQTESRSFNVVGFEMLVADFEVTCQTN